MSVGLASEQVDQPSDDTPTGDQSHVLKAPTDNLTFYLQRHTFMSMMYSFKY